MSDEPKSEERSDEEPGPAVGEESSLEPPPDAPDDLRISEPLPDVDDAAESLAVVDSDETPVDRPEVASPVPPPQGADAVLDAVGSVFELGTRIERRLGELQNQFDREIRAETTREKVIDRLHAELQEYKQDLLLNVLRPVFIDLIQLHDDVGKVAVSPSGPNAGEVSEEARRFATLLEGFQQGIEDILYRQGVEPFQVEGDVFDPRQQRAVATVPADDPAQNKTVAARHRKGFRAGDRVIRPEIVSVYAVKK